MQGAIQHGNREIVNLLISKIPLERLEDLLIDKDVDTLYDTSLLAAVTGGRLDILHDLYRAFARLRAYTHLPLSHYLNFVDISANSAGTILHHELLDNFEEIDENGQTLAFQILLSVLQHGAATFEARTIDGTPLQRMEFLHRNYPDHNLQSCVHLLAACSGTSHRS